MSGGTSEDIGKGHHTQTPAGFEMGAEGKDQVSGGEQD